jgi:glycosyltransferase involved in cell wall biosynthesis
MKIAGTAIFAASTDGVKTMHALVSENSLIPARVLIIVPAYNEEESIVSVVRKLMACYPQFDIVVVNDGSTDHTAELCRLNEFPLLDLATNLGLAGAVVTGMRYAYENDYDVAIQFDADGQHRPEYLQAMVDELSRGADVVCGSRFLEGKKHLSSRMIGNSLIAFLIRLASSQRLTDPTSGLRAYAKRVIKLFATQIDITPEPDTISYLIKLGASISEVPVTMNRRTTGISYLTFSRSIKYISRMVISILILQPIRRGNLDASESRC